MDFGNLGETAKAAFKDNEEKVKAQVEEKADQLIDSKVTDESTAQKVKDAVGLGADKAFSAINERLGTTDSSEEKGNRP